MYSSSLIKNISNIQKQFIIGLTFTAKFFFGHFTVYMFFKYINWCIPKSKLPINILTSSYGNSII